MARIDRIAQVAQRHVDSGALSGLEWRIIRQGSVWTQGRYGLADGLNGREMAASPIYRIFSMTKPLISALAMMLIEQGHLRLYDPVMMYLPEFSTLSVHGSDQPARPITVEHLLTHRAGLSYGFLRDCPVAALYRAADLRDSRLSLAEFVRRLAAQPLAFQPGSAWRYSVATDVLARLIEVVLERPLPEILQDYILGPLGLRDTGFSVPEAEQHRIMAIYGKSNLDDCMVFDDLPQTLQAANVEAECPTNDPAFYRGGLGLFSTLDDYCTVAMFLKIGMAPDGGRLLSSKAIEMMWTDRIPACQKPLKIGPFEMAGYGWGLAGRVMAAPSRAMVLTEQGEAGWAGAASTFFWIDPKNDLIGVVMAQYVGSKIPIGEDFQTAVYQALEE